MRITSHHLRQIHGALMKMTRVVLGNGYCDPTTCVSDMALRAQFDIPCFRVVLGHLRLTYLPVLAAFPQPNPCTSKHC